MSVQVSRQVIEKVMADRFKGKNCCFHYPGYDPVYGMVDEISIEDLDEPMVIIQMNSKRYEVSPESLNDCLTLLKK